MLKEFQKINSRKTVFVGMSGGVDSSVAAFLLKEEGYRVIGIHIRGYNVDGCAENDAIMARRAAEKLNIPFYVWNMEKEYKDKVVNYMISGYKNGITPNPDVMCNKEIKFGIFYKKAIKIGADFIATGHYARIDGGKHIIKTPKDEDKDQTYFLWAVKKEILKKILFPLGELLKSEVREIAAKINLPNADRKDSQGICFLGQLKMSDFLSKYIKENPGPIMTTEGKKIGEHKGLFFYTIGQRHLGIKGLGGSQALYVAGKNKKNNSLILSPKNDNFAYSKKIFSLKDVNFFISLKKENDVLARTRYREPLFEAKLLVEKGKKRLILSNSFNFIAPGQSAVFYSDQKEMIGGGIIS